MVFDDGDSWGQGVDDEDAEDHELRQSAHRGRVEIRFGFCGLGSCMSLRRPDRLRVTFWELDLKFSELSILEVGLTGVDWQIRKTGH